MAIIVLYSPDFGDEAMEMGVFDVKSSAAEGRPQQRCASAIARAQRVQATIGHVLRGSSLPRTTVRAHAYLD